MKITSFRVTSHQKKPLLHFDISFDALIPPRTRAEIKFNVRKTIQKIIAPNDFLQNHKRIKHTREEPITIREASAFLKVPYKNFHQWKRNTNLNFPVHKELGTTVYYKSELEKFRSDNPGLFGVEKLLTIKEVTDILIIDQKMIKQWRNDPKINFPFYQKSKTSRIFYYESEVRNFMEKNRSSLNSQSCANT